MHKFAVNDNAEDFPKVSIDAYPPVVIGVKFVSTFVELGESLVTNIGEDARAEDDVKEFKYSQFSFSLSPDPNTTLFLSLFSSALISFLLFFPCLRPNDGRGKRFH
jgi:hypothetical protein